jgi:type II secretory pathway component GspD/PulD (secretin)
MAALWPCCHAVIAQEGGESTKQAVLLQFPGEHDLATLVDYVSQRLQIKIMYDGNLATRKINIRAPKDVPVESLLGVLQSALRMNGLALIDTNTPGWKRVVDVARLHEGAVEQDAQSAIEKSGGETPVTQVFVLQHADPAQLEQSIRPFLSSGSTTGVPTASANILALKEQRMLIVTDFASNIVRLERLIKLIDQPRESVVTRFVPTRVLDAKTLSEKIERLLDARRRASGQASDATASRGAEVAFDERTNKVILVGTQQDVQHLEEYLKTLDVPADIRTEVYAPRRLAAERLQRIVTSMLEVRESRPAFRAAVDEDQNLLIV